MRHSLPRCLRFVALALLGLGGLAAARPVLGDIVFYTLPGSDLTVVLQGKTKVNQGGTVTFNHPKLGTMYFKLEAGTEIKEVPTLQEQFAKQLGRAGNDANKRFEAAQWALRHGLLPQFYEAVDKALEANPQHPRGLLIKKLKTLMDQPIADSSQQEKEVRDLIGRPEMKIAMSKHYILLHDTPDKPAANRRKPRAQERLDLLEQVYESFLLRFYASGVELQIPKERLKIVLFQEHQDYLFFATKLDAGLSRAAGFWSSDNNTGVFYDNGTTEEFKQLVKLSEDLQDIKKDAVKGRFGGAADIRRLADTLQYVINMERENMDIEVVSHEATHQMAGNTGLLPRDVRIPTWVHEGLATYFEAPDGASWGGIGTVNKDRLEWYRMLERDREHSNIDFIVGDQIFDYAGSHASTVHGYGQAWALTHFLMEKHFDGFIAFYRRLGEMPPEVQLSQEILNKMFDECIKVDRAALDVQWRNYMRGLKTDLEIIEESR
jgi:uncharacterized protein DUF1570